MTRHLLSKRLSLVAAMALLITAPGIALGQDGSGGSGGSGSTGNSADGDITIQILSIGGANQNTVGKIWIGLQQCSDNAEIEFRLDGVPDRQVFDIYTGANCNTADARDGEGDDCDPVREGVEITGPDDQRIRLPAEDIIHTAFETDDCGSRSSVPKLWFLAVDNSGTTEGIVADDYGMIELNIDTEVPDAPTKIKGGSGENEIPVSWSAGNENVDKFEVYVDTGSGMQPMRDGSVEPEPEPEPTDDEDGGADGEPTTGGETNAMCGTGALVEGASTEGLSSLVKGGAGSATATSTTLSSEDIGGDVAAVAVVALDEAGNRSTLSEVVCVYVVPTTGFKDLYEQQHGAIPQGCPCSAAGPAQIEGVLPIALALGLIAYRRRRRS